MSGTIDEMRAAPLSTSRGLHHLKSTGKLIHTPIALARNETRRHIDGAVRKRFKLGDVFADKASIPLQGRPEIRFEQIRLRTRTIVRQ